MAEIKVRLRVREAREARGITQDELSDAIGISRQSIKKWEHNQTMPKIDVLVRVANYLGCTVESLYDIEAE
ncbi:helix-turn-helix transcriptional regulator [uncultured Senegalimassilia sp.]|uniref:helix-turn-helix domain-containing protein n=1 Tax=uncultured Senegalimassilia sp. TaxID=1714350 RepID=UPI002628B85A|nr:helix-turn-helix transcriptional regulator [uncultured Senegalimassilia sp.]